MDLIFFMTSHPMKKDGAKVMSFDYIGSEGNNLVSLSDVSARDISLTFAL